MINSVGTGRPIGGGTDGEGSQIDNEIRRLQKEIKSLKQKSGKSDSEQIQKQIQALQEKIAQLQQRKAQASKNNGGQGSASQTPQDALSEAQQGVPSDQLLDVYA